LVCVRATHLAIKVMARPGGAGLQRFVF
jgi:hypothetical protein